MKQVVQAVGGGAPRVVTVPAPSLRPGGVLVRTAWSLVSAGTDRMIIDLAGKSLAGKARSRPDQVGKVLSKLRTDGLAATLDAVRARLRSDLPLGYSASGTVTAVGAGVTDVPVGREVACAGMGFASHAEEIFVPRNLLVPVPEGLDLRSASTVTLGAIAMQGFRRAEPRLGERVGVVGLGLLGLLTVQILRTAGCRVFAVDLDEEKVALARDLGAESAVTRGAGGIEEKARAFGGGHGLDAAIVTAAAPTSDPTVLAARMCRLGGRVVVVGAVGMDLPRRLFYEKELELRLARSYGPGRHDPVYEEKGIDYPYPWVRFTEGRNMEEYIALLGRGEVDVDPLLTHEFGIEEGEGAYRFLMSEEGSGVVGLLFRYDGGRAGERETERRRRVDLRPRAGGRSGVGVALVGAGAFARSVLLPALGKMPDFNPTGVVTSSGLTAVNAGKGAGFRYATTSLSEVLGDEDTDAVVVATRHGEHARIAEAALRAGKAVFLEKPLALSREELATVTRAVVETGRLLMVGFNRRLAPSYVALRDAFRGRAGPLSMIYRVNAGPLPKEHWTRDLEAGGGRILGEVCHFVDLLTSLAGAPPERVFAEPLPEEGTIATLRFRDGSSGTVVYATTGSPAAGKERLEVFGDEITAVLDGFTGVTIHGSGRRRRVRAAGKGHRQELRAFLDAVRTGGPSPIPYSQAAWSTLATLAIVESLSTGEPVTLAEG
ncbi:MAG: bi-domain-containing oxidoreductase [Planctomycetota bacterium]|jgi:predicted dehydrogenase/threonine dehydrogenase-like Zn-dependent dehydrogenase